MARGSTFCNDFLKLIFNATAIANIADNAATSPLTNLYLSLHTADPGAGGSQTTSEVTYTSYARVAVLRTTGGWTVTSNAVSPAATISFPAGTGGSGTATYMGGWHGIVGCRQTVVERRDFADDRHRERCHAAAHDRDDDHGDLKAGGNPS
jgi:hypothetical protein